MRKIQIIVNMNVQNVKKNYRYEKMNKNKLEVGDKLRCVDADVGITKGQIYSVESVDDDGDPVVENDDGIISPFYARDFEKVNKIGRPAKEKPEDLIRYMVSNISTEIKCEVFKTQEEMKTGLNAKAEDEEWLGRIIGYECIPLYEAKRTIKLNPIGRKYKKRGPKRKKKK